MGATGQGSAEQDAAEVNKQAVRGRSVVGGVLAGLRLTVTSGVAGAAIAALVVGVILERVPVFLSGGGALILLVLVGFVAGRRSPEPADPPVTRTALARIEDLRATSGESADVPVDFRLTVAPEPEDERSAYRVDIDERINLVDLPVYRPRSIAVVEYRPDEPWEVRIVTRPTPEWSRRAEEAEIDSAPESTLVEKPGPSEGSWCVLMLIMFLAGAATVVLLFRGELFASDGDAGASSKQPSGTSSAASSSRTFTTSTTVSGPSSSLLVLGRMRETAAELEARVGTADVTAILIEERRMEIRGDSARPPGETVHLQMLPYELFPALVHEARTTLGVRAPKSWRIDVTPGPSTGVGPRVRVTVTGKEGTAHLDADATARILDRRPVGEAAEKG
ncbi:GlsB/YeaQ/YmgE family stress response membrane protein [Streptomyces anulatus]|uniref:GlsB/YeaQ/YmgE family stress response membrane protein n=1 Tax=Streptomyces anulatus TaxID=1892 RepID=UPI00363B1628